MEDNRMGVHEANEKCHKENEIREEVDHQQLICGDAVIISIQDMLKHRPRFHGDQSSIFRVPKQLLEMNHKAYVPQLISIGPFHHDSEDLLAGNQYKLESLDNFLYLMDKKEALEILVNNTTQSWVEKARSCYAEPMDHMKDDEELVKMMLVDGCFIVNLIMLHNDQLGIAMMLIKHRQEMNIVSLTFYLRIIPAIYLDLIKLENQVPFFVLEDLFDRLPTSSKLGSNSILNLLDLVPISGFLQNYKLPVDLPRKPKHLTDLLRMYFLPMHLLWKDQHNQESNEQNSGKNNNFLSFFYLKNMCLLLENQKIIRKTNNFLRIFYFKYIHPLWQKCVQKNSGNPKYSPTRGDKSGPMPFIFQKALHRKSSDRSIPPSISELHEAGVTIKKAENLKCITNISFNNGVLEIPPLHIDDSFETIMRNLLVSEHFSTAEEEEESYVVHYMFFMDDLISTEKDVSLLVKAEVLINNIGGNDEEVSELFNNLCKYVMYSTSSPHDGVTKDLLEHCNRGWNKSKASLKHDYFNTPWAFVSFVAATFVIVLTILQTIFSAISAFP